MSVAIGIFSFWLYFTSIVLLVAIKLLSPGGLFILSIVFLEIFVFAIYLEQDHIKIKERV